MTLSGAVDADVRRDERLSRHTTYRIGGPAALFVAARLGARDNLPRERIYDLGLWMLIAALVGSKLMLLWTEPSYRADPSQLLSLDFLRSGGVFYGGFIRV